MVRGRIAILILFGALAVPFGIAPAFADKKQAQKEIVWSADETPIHDGIHGLRALPDDQRARTTKDLALKIRQLPPTENKLRLAVGLANLSTEGDFGHGTLQEVATTLAATLKERPLPWPNRNRDESDSKPTHATEGIPSQARPAGPYMELASLVRYEHVEAALDDNDQYRAAVASLEADDHKREHAEFLLKDLTGKTWKFSDLRGKVVLLNFWATWCPPCRKEMPDLEALYEKFSPQGLVILGISDDEPGKVRPFIRDRNVTFPVLLDRGGKVSKALVVEGIPKTFIYDREGKLVAQSIDMRTRDQFLAMLAKAGIQ